MKTRTSAADDARRCRVVRFAPLPGRRGSPLRPAQAGNEPRMSIFRTLLFCFGGAFVGQGIYFRLRGRSNARLYVAIGIVLVICGLLLYLL
jgi:hypothetical protein